MGAPHRSPWGVGAAAHGGLCPKGEGGTRDHRAALPCTEAPQCPRSGPGCRSRCTRTERPPRVPARQVLALRLRAASDPRPQPPTRRVLCSRLRAAPLFCETKLTF